MPSQQTSRVVWPIGFFGLFLVVAMTFSLWLYWQAAEGMVWNHNAATGQGAVDQLLLQIHWKALETPEDITLKKEVDKLVEQFADRLGERGIEATLLYRPDAPQYSTSGSGKPANQFETDLIAQFMLSRSGGKEELTLPENCFQGQNHVCYYQPIYAKRECTNICHSAAPPGGVFGASTTDRLAEGDLMAIAKISLTNHEMRETIHAIRNQFLVIAIVTTSLVMIAFCVAIRVTTARNAPPND